MISFYRQNSGKVFAVSHQEIFSSETEEKLIWLFAGAEKLSTDHFTHMYVGPRSAMITPWSTNAVEITQNMDISGIDRIEEFVQDKDNQPIDPMISQRFSGLHDRIFDIDAIAAPIQEISDIHAYNKQEGLSLSDEEVGYLEGVAKKINRKLTDSEVFGFSQVNSEHCRHKIFNGTFIIDEDPKESSLFQLIKKTSKENPNSIVSAYKDNVAFVNGPTVKQFAPARPDCPSYYEEKDFHSVISIKAETHNFPTTVEPFNGAATGSGGEIRDRLAGGQGSIPLSGTAVYMTSYSRLHDKKPWEQKIKARNWLYQTPLDILIKASNGASDFGNKFGQPLISGSLLTFEHEENGELTAFDKVIMMAGGIGYGKHEQAIKKTPQKEDKIVILGGENYRIGMGGAAVSSADTGELNSGLELNAVQRSNPEMQKRAANTVRGMVELDENPIVSIHDHGAGGHLNCLSELVEDTGGKINLDKLPIGDPTLSAMEIIGNESQERMGLVIGSEDVTLLQKIASRERSPMYEVGTVTEDHRFTFESESTGEKPMDLALEDMFGSSPKTILNDKRTQKPYAPVSYDASKLTAYVKQVLQLEAVACKDWLTNKVDRCVGGKVAAQQTVGELQIPLNNVGVMALDFQGRHGIANAIGHASASALIDATSGAQNAIAESLTNIIWAPLENGLESVSLSANWMWPCKNPGEDARLYDAVKAVSDFAIELGINIPTGKDSLSMAQKYPSKTVLAPGTVIITAAGHVSDVRKVVEPVLQAEGGDIIYIDFSHDQYKLGGSSFAQILGQLGHSTPSIIKSENHANVKTIFNTVQKAIKDDLILAGHDISAGGMITALLEWCFPSTKVGADINLSELSSQDLVEVGFAENAGIILQANDGQLGQLLRENNVKFHVIGKANNTGKLKIQHHDKSLKLSIGDMRDIWFETSYLLDSKQTAADLAKARFDNYKEQPLHYIFPTHFRSRLAAYTGKRPKAAILREKGSNSEREMANALFQVGFDVKDVHMTDLMEGRETLEDIQFLGAVGGFSNSDVLGSAKGWAGAIKYNDKASTAIKNFFARKDTLSIGICNGCQLFLELDLINPNHSELSKMKHNDSQKHECNFTSVEIEANDSVMMSNLGGAKLGVWISHGEGKFDLPLEESQYNIVGKYGYEAYPANPNGSAYNTAMLVSDDGRHLVTMPHIERSFFAWNWAHYPNSRSNDEFSPWAIAFINARNWILKINE